MVPPQLLIQQSLDYILCWMYREIVKENSERRGTIDKDPERGKDINKEKKKKRNMSPIFPL